MLLNHFIYIIYLYNIYSFIYLVIYSFSYIIYYQNSIFNLINFLLIEDKNIRCKIIHLTNML